MNSSIRHRTISMLSSIYIYSNLVIKIIHGTEKKKKSDKKDSAFLLVCTLLLPQFLELQS